MNQRRPLSDSVDRGETIVETFEGKHNSSICPFIVVLALCLVAFWLRVVGTAGLSMWGDSSYSVYSANLSPLRILTERIYDGHPPLYYYLLHFWSLMTGNSEVSVRFLSLFWGVLTVPLAMVVGQRLGGRSVGLIAALLVTISPELVYYSRLIRMYSLASFLALLSLYFFWLALRRGSWRYWVLYFLVTLAALYTHYYTILLVVAEAAFFLKLVWQRRAERNLVPWLGVHSALAVLYLPWLAYAGPTQAETTAGIISHAPAAKGLLGFLEQAWVPFNVGVTLDKAVALPLSIAFLAIAVVGLVAWRLRKANLSPLIQLLLTAVVIPLLLSYPVFLVFPYAVRGRFLLTYLPAYLILLAWLVLGWRALHSALLPVVLALIVASQAYSLADTYYVERNILEPPVIMVTQQLERLAQAGDAVVFHAAWEIGYFESHYRGQPVTLYALNDVETVLPPSGLTSHKRVWLIMFRVGIGDADYPLETWFVNNWVRLGDWQMEENRVALYIAPPQGDWQPMMAEFWDRDGQPALRLTDVCFGPTQLQGGDVIGVGLRWQPVRDLARRYTVFLHLLDGQGNRVAGRDDEPLAGLNPMSGWRAGDVIEDRMGLILPVDLPPGDYRLVLGLYPTGSPQEQARLPGEGLFAPGGTALLGSIWVEGAEAGRLRPAQKLSAVFDDSLELIGYDTDLDSFQIGGTKDIHPMLEETITLTFPREAYDQGETINLTLYWRSLTNVSEDYRWDLELVDRYDQVVAQAEGPLLRWHEVTSAWRKGELAISHLSLPLSDDLPAGEYRLRLGLSQKPGSEWLAVTWNGTESANMMLGQIDLR